MTYHPHVSAEPSSPSLPDSAIVPVRPREDGWTPDRQRQFIEELADTGCVKEAAGRVGMTEQSAFRLRRRCDAAGFDAAWEAALEKGLQRVTSMAFDHAINGKRKRVYYHGELVAEEIVHSERLMIYLLERGREALGRARERRRMVEDWDKGIESLGVDEGPYRVWRGDAGRWVTNFPPPQGFDGFEEQYFGHPRYYRTLTKEETIAAEAREQARLAQAERARNRFFGLDGAEE